MLQNILGVQTQRGGEVFASLVRATWPASIKLIDCLPLELVAEWRAHRPDGLLVYRKWYPNGDGSLAEARTRSAETIAAATPLLAHGPVFLEAPWNEERANGAGLDVLAAQTRVFVDMALEAGMIPVVFVLPEGNPADKRDLRRPAVIALLRYVVGRVGFVVVGDHGYSDPPLAPDDEWHFANWDFWTQALAAEAPDLLGKVLFYQGELGLDGGVANGVLPQRTETGFRGYGLTPGQYARDWLGPEHRRMLREPTVIGGAVFGSDMSPPWNSPSGFDVTDEVDVRPAFTEQVEAPPRAAIPWPPKEQRMSLRFVDLSNWQGVVDMAALKADGVDGVIIKLSEDGGYVDPFGPANTEHARAAGLLLAFYHFARPSLASPSASWTAFAAAIEAAGGMRPLDGFFLDSEDGVGDLATWSAEWGGEAIQARGVKAGFYSGPWFMGPHNLEIAGVAVQFCGLWEAAPTADPAAIPSAVPGWDKLVMVQWSFHGHVGGVEGEVDLDTFLGSIDDWRALWAPVVSPASVVPAPVATPPVPPPAPDPITAALDDLWGLTEQVAPLNMPRAVEAQSAVHTLKVALGRQTA